GARVGARDDALRRDEAPPRARGRRARRHPPLGPGEAALPEPGADPADPRPVDRQVHGAPRGGARGPEARAGGDGMSTTTDQATQVYSVFIRATPEAVWEAITKPEFTAKYFYGSVFDTTWEPGSALEGWAADRSQQYVDGEILEVEPPHKLVTTWRALYDPETAAEAPSRVTWEIEQAGEQVTKLTV